MMHSDTNDWKAFELFTEGMNCVQAYKKNKHYSELELAKDKLWSAVIKDPDFVRAVYHLAIVNDMLGDHKKAVDLLMPILDYESPFKLETLYTLGLAFFHQYTFNKNTYDISIKYFELAIEHAQKLYKQEYKVRSITVSLLSHAGLANVYAHLSIISPKESKDNESKTADYYFNQTKCEYEYVTKELDINRFVLDKDVTSEISWLIHNAIGVAYMYKGMKYRDKDPNILENSLDHLRKAENFNINHITRSNIGSASLFLSDLIRDKNPKEADTLIDKSIDCFKDVLSMRKNYDFAYYRLARLMRTKAEFTKAQKFIELAEKYRNEISQEQIEKEKKRITDEHSHEG